MWERQEITSDVAKAIADKIGHGMREKCEVHAVAAMEYLDEYLGGDLALIIRLVEAQDADFTRVLDSYKHA